MAHSIDVLWHYDRNVQVVHMHRRSTVNCALRDYLQKRVVTNYNQPTVDVWTEIAVKKGRKCFIILTLYRRSPDRFI
jgi:hypothetical protein